jgi:hypothetical protein
MRTCPAGRPFIRISTEIEINGNDKPVQLSIEEGNPLNFLGRDHLRAFARRALRRMLAAPGLAGFCPVWR